MTDMLTHPHRATTTSTRSQGQDRVRICSCGKAVKAHKTQNQTFHRAVAHSRSIPYQHAGAGNSHAATSCLNTTKTPSLVVNMQVQATVMMPHLASTQLRLALSCWKMAKLMSTRLKWKLVWCGGELLEKMMSMARAT